MLTEGRGSVASSPFSSPTQAGPDPAQTLLDRHRQPGGHDVEGLARDVRRVAQGDPGEGSALASRIETGLSPVDRGRFAAALQGPGAGDVRSVAGQAFRIGDPFAPAIRDWGTMPAGSPYRAAWDRTAASLGTTDSALVAGAIERSLYGHTIPAQQAAAAPVAAGQTGPDPVQLALDLTQMGLDLAGIVDPTGIADGGNAVVSLGRAIGSLFSGNLSEAGGHAVNAGISVAGIVPVLGDLAKAGKIGKWAQTISDSVRAIAQNPALRASLEPGLRAAHEAIGKIPQGALDALPQSARTAIERMKSELDGFFAGGARAADDVPTYRATVRGEEIVLHGVDSVPVTYVKRDRGDYAALRREFDNSVRGDFARSLAGDPAKVAALRQAGLDDAAIERLASGRIPAGWQVHHKLPLDDGGTNAFDNLVLIRNDPHHIGITNAQRELVGDLAVGQSRQVDFPVPRGFVYPPRP